MAVMQQEAVKLIPDRRYKEVVEYVCTPPYPVSCSHGEPSATVTVPTLEYRVSNRLPESKPGLSPLPPVLHTWKVPRQDGANFSRIKHEGRIKMSEYKVGQVLTTFKVGTIPLESTFVFPGLGRTTSVNSPTWDHVSGSEFRTRVAQPGCNDVPKWKSSFTVPDIEVKRSLELTTDVFEGDYDPVQYSSDICNTIETLKTEVLARLNKEVDLATDFRERKATAETAKGLLQSALHPLRDAKRFISSNGLNPLKYTQSAAKGWLTYRYGIMPTLYSIQDVLALSKKEPAEFKTARARRTIRVSTDLSKVPKQDCTYVVQSGTVRISATAKVRLLDPALAKFHGTSLNYITAIWETIPYSLVVDWLSNVGNYLHSMTNFNGGLIRDSASCYAVKTDVVKELYARRVLDGRQIDVLIATQRVKTYDRIPFTKQDTKIVFDPKFANYLRWVDAFALSLNPLKKALRRLK